MAFVKETVTKDDIAKYKLDQIRAEFDKWRWRNGRPSFFVHEWCIDRDLNTFLILLHTIEEVGPSGRPEPTNKKKLILSNNGEIIEFTMEIDQRSTDTEIRINWHIIESSMQKITSESRCKFLDLLKNSLIAYGYNGVNFNQKRIVVEFNF